MNLYPNRRGLVKMIPISPEQFENIILNQEKYQTNPQSKKDFLEKYISTASGGASERTEQEIINTIKQYKKDREDRRKINN